MTRSDDIGHLGLPRFTIVRSELHAKSVWLRLLNFYEDIFEKSPAARKLAYRFSRDARIQQHCRKSINDGILISPMSLHRFVSWYLWTANEHGKQIAESELEKFLESSEREMIYAQWVMGVIADARTDICSGIQICDAESMPFSHEKESFIGPGLVGVETAAPQAAIITEYRKTKFHEDQPGVPPERTLSTNLTSATYLLNLVKGVTCAPFCSACYSEAGPFGPFPLSAYSSEAEVIPRDAIKLTNEHLRVFRDLYAGYQNRSQDEKSIIDLASKRLAMAKCHHQAEDKILDLCIALESVLLGGKKTKGISRKFQARGAWIIGGNAGERKIASERLRSIYDWRSEIVHTGRIGNGVADLTEANAAVPDCIRLTEQVLSYVATNGIPNWKYSQHE